MHSSSLLWNVGCHACVQSLLTAFFAWVTSAGKVYNTKEFEQKAAAKFTFLAESNARDDSAFVISFGEMLFEEANILDLSKGEGDIVRWEI